MQGTVLNFFSDSAVRSALKIVIIAIHTLEVFPLVIFLKRLLYSLLIFAFLFLHTQYRKFVTMLQILVGKAPIPALLPHYIPAGRGQQTWSCRPTFFQKFH